MDKNNKILLIHLPQDLLFMLLFYLQYNEIKEICLTSRKIYKIYNNEIFWKLYTQIKNIKKDNEKDTYKQTALLNYLGKYEPNKDGHYLYEIKWNLAFLPNNLQKYTGPSHESVLLTEKEYNKIVFRNTVKIKVRCLTGAVMIRCLTGGILESQNVPLEVPTELELKPNTPIGSTLKYTLEKVYRAMYNLSEKDKLVNGEKICGEDIYSLNATFECLHKTDDETYFLYFESS